MDKLNLREYALAIVLLVGILLVTTLIFKPVDQDPFPLFSNEDIETSIRKELNLGPLDTLSLTAKEGGYSKWNLLMEEGIAGFVIVAETKAGIEIVATSQSELSCKDAAIQNIPTSVMETCIDESGITLDRVRGLVLEVQPAISVYVPDLRLLGITPQFLALNAGNDAVLTASQKSIKEAALGMVGAEQPEQYSLRAIGTRYAVLTFYPATSLNPRDQIIDFQARTVTDLPASYSFEVRDIIVYITSYEIFYYKLDTPSLTLLAESVLNEKETYDSSAGMMPGPGETHTDTTLTLNVYDSTSGSYGVVEYDKVREVLFTLP